MVTFSKQNKSSLQRRGKQLLKSKFTLYNKRRKGTMLPKKKLFAPTIVLPASLQLSSYIKPNTIRTVHTTGKTTSSSALFQNGFSGSTTQSNNDRSSSKGSVGVDVNVEKKPKKNSIKTLFGIKRDKKSPMKGAVDATVAAVRTKTSTIAAAIPRIVTTTPKNLDSGVSTSFPNQGSHNEKLFDDTLLLEQTGSGETASTTNPNTPVRGTSDNDNFDNITFTPSTESSTSAAGNGKSRRPYIFLDTDDETDHDDDVKADQALNDEEKKELDGSTRPANAATNKERQNYAGDNNSEDNIQDRIEQELNRLFDRVRKQNAAKSDIAKEQLESAVAEEKEDIDAGDSGEEEKESNPSQNSEPQESSMDEPLFDPKCQSPIIRPQNCATAKSYQTRFFSLLSRLLPAVLLMHWFVSKVLVTPYNHDTARERAQTFFRAESTESPMEGITVIVSETESKLGSAIEDRFARLGATVASIDIDCNDLNSVADSVDSVVEKFGMIDFLIHTGNLCLLPRTDQTMNDNIESITSTTLQGHDALFAGNYLSSFLVTQKILPRLEQSRFGTLVQFTSPASAFVDGSQLKIESSSSEDINTGPRPAASLLLQQQETYFSTLLHLPLEFAYAKLSEILQHRVLTRAYPNIRTMEISRGWRINGEGGADDFFDRIFGTEEGGAIPSSTAIGNDEDLQDSLYEWSQNAVWKWVAPPTPAPIIELLLGSPIGPQIGTIRPMDTTGESPAAVTYFPANTVSVVTSSALFLLAMKAKTVVWGAGGSLSSSE